MTTFATGAAIGEREQLADVIYRIDPTETPIFSNVKKETSNGIFTEWQVQELAAASTTNYHNCLLYTSPSPRDGLLTRMPSSA